MPLIEVTGCPDCPFYERVSDGCMADTGKCLLKGHLAGEATYIELENTNDAFPRTPEWCPLINEEYTVTGKLEGK